MRVSRNPFTREELHKRPVLVKKEDGCSWCGKLAYTRHARPRPLLYEFSFETDGGTTRKVKWLFCRVACYKAYHWGTVE